MRCFEAFKKLEAELFGETQKFVGAAKSFQAEIRPRKENDLGHGPDH